MICNNCNKTIDDDSKFCTKCGQELDSRAKLISSKKTGKKSILVSVFSVIIFILAFGVARYLTQEIFSPSSSNYSKTDLVNQTVKEVKAEMSLPSQIDEVTTLVDITAESDAIRYHYVLSDVDTSTLTNNYLKSYVGSSICQNKDTKKLLDQDINMEYSYSVKNLAETYFISFTKTDCE